MTPTPPSSLPGPRRGVLTAEPVELPRLAGVLTTAFADNPISDWLFHGEQDHHHPAFFAAFLRWALRGGRVEQTHDGTAVAIWIDYTIPPGDLLDDFQTEILDAVGRHRTRWLTLDHATANEHPAPPHWWLAFLGVLPTHRGRGAGSALLRHGAHWQDGQPAYLEATSRRLSTYYHHHGYQPTDTIDVPHGPTLYGMWRDAAPATGGGS